MQLTLEPEPRLPSAATRRAVLTAHGTNAPRLIPGRPSHGCIRMRNHALLRLARLLPVGTPVTIG